MQLCMFNYVMCQHVLPIDEFRPAIGALELVLQVSGAIFAVMLVVVHPLPTIEAELVNPGHVMIQIIRLHVGVAIVVGALYPGRVVRPLDVRPHIRASRKRGLAAFQGAGKFLCPPARALVEVLPEISVGHVLATVLAGLFGLDVNAPDVLGQVVRLQIDVAGLVGAFYRQRVHFDLVDLQISLGLEYRLAIFRLASVFFDPVAGASGEVRFQIQSCHRFAAVLAGRFDLFVNVLQVLVQTVGLDEGVAALPGAVYVIRGMYLLYVQIEVEFRNERRFAAFETAVAGFDPVAGASLSVEPHVIDQDELFAVGTRTFCFVVDLLDVPVEVVGLEFPVAVFHGTLYQLSVVDSPEVLIQIFL